MIKVDQDGVARAAGISSDGVYRWWLTRCWYRTGPWVHFLMLNPSTADADLDDPTIRRVMGFARSWGFSGVVVTNLFALRATDPTVLWNAGIEHGHNHIVGGLNDTAILGGAGAAAYTVCAWGSDRNARIRSREVLAKLDGLGVDLRALRVAKSGAPWHPLYVSGATQAMAYTVRS
jgi:hypothetical protein